MPAIQLIVGASVKVMRSYDYCHFEISLSIGGVPDGTQAFLSASEQLSQIDNLRKEAARLADKAVEQYKIAKSWASRTDSMLAEFKWKVQVARSTPESERTPEAQAIIKQDDDNAFVARIKYDYEDDWE